MKLLFLNLLLLLGAFFSSAQTPSFVTQELPSYIANGMKDWKIPGLALVIVKDGKIVEMKGYGVLDIDTKEPVTASSRFMIASNSKLFTGTALATLQVEGKVDLNQPIKQYLKGFKLYNSLLTDHVTVRDMLTHRLGTTTFQGDFTFWNTNLTRSEILDKMKYLKPSGIFRQDYGYCNSCFLAAGEVIPIVTNQSWESYVQEKLIDPLEMQQTQVLSTGVNQLSNMATPYTTAFTDSLRRLPFDNWNNLAPAASIISSVSDLSHWLIAQLDSGKWKGRQVIPWKAMQMTRDIQIVTGSRKSTQFPMHIRGYGLGVFVADYNGRQIYWHTGGAGGMVSNVCFVPEENLGIAILTNNDNQNFFESLRYQLLDAYLGVPFVNRSKVALAGHVQEMKAVKDSIQFWRASTQNAKSSLPIINYTGKYNHPLYGDIALTQNGPSLTVSFSRHPALSATVQPMKDGRWLLTYNNIAYGIFAIDFIYNGKRVDGVSIKASDFVEYEPYFFKKQ